MSKIGFALTLILEEVLESVFKVSMDELSGNIFFMTILGLIVALIVVNSIYTGCYQRSYAKKIKNIKELLGAGRAAEAINRTKELLEKVKRKEIKTELTINLASAYICNKEYENAINMLNDIAETELNTDELTLSYAVNLFSAYYQKTNHSLAISTYTKYKKIIEKYEENEQYCDAAFEIHIQYLIIINEWEEAYTLTQKALSESKDKKWKEKFKEYENSIITHYDKIYPNFNFVEEYEKERNERQRQEELSNRPIKKLIDKLTYALLFFSAFFSITKIIRLYYGYDINSVNDKILIIAMDLIFILILILTDKEGKRISELALLLIPMFIIPLSVVNGAISLSSIGEVEIIMPAAIVIFYICASVFYMKYIKQIKQLRCKNKSFPFVSILLVFIGFGILVYRVFFLGMDR